MKNSTRKVISILMLVICILSLTGCGKSEEEVMQQGMMQQEMEDKTDVTFEGENIELTGIDGTLCDYTIKNGKLYLLTSKTVDDEGENAKEYQFYSSDITGNIIELIREQPLAEADVVSFCADEAGNLLYIAEALGADGNNTVELIKLDGKGTELARQDITKLVKNDVSLLGGIVSDSTGQAAIACGEKVYFFDGELTKTGEVQTQNGSVVDMALTKNNQIVCVTDEPNSAVVSIEVYLLDPGSKRWGDMLDIRTEQNGESDFVMDGLDYDFYYMGRSGIYGYDIETKTDMELINYDASYMTSMEAEGMICADKDTFIGKSEDFAEGSKQVTLVSYTKKDMNAVNDKEVITFGTFYASSDAKNAIAKFNRSQEEYQIVIEEYMYMDESRLLADIVAGKGQDIMDLSSFPLSVEQCIAKGLIENLTPYYDKDSDVSTSDLVDSVRTAMEHDGKLYYIAPSFRIVTLAARTEDVGNNTGWSVADLRALMEKKGETMNLFSGVDIKESYLGRFIDYTVSDYIDWENGTCSFDSEDFKYILELCNEKGLKEEDNISDAEIVEQVNSQYSRFKNGEYALLVENEMDLGLIQLERKLVGDGITYIGFPNKEKNGSYFEFNNKYAISSQSKVKEQAWEFIRGFLSKEYQRTLIYSDMPMPILQSSFDNKMKALTATEAYVDEFGETVEPVKEESGQWGDIEYVMGVPTKEDVEVYLNLIKQTNRCADSDDVIINIILEEAQDYFHGKRKLDKTVDNIQQRVTTYVNEQKK